MTHGRLALLLIVLVFGSLGAAVALAHTEGTTQFEGSGNSWCMFDRAEINGEQRATAAIVYSYQAGCVGLKSKDPFKLRTKDNLLKQGGNGSYFQCSEGALTYNQQSTASHATVTFYGGAFCGGGRYKTRALTGLQDSGNWRSGLVDSPPHMMN